jgi:hypothetical protein
MDPLSMKKQILFASLAAAMIANVGCDSGKKTELAQNGAQALSGANANTANKSTGALSGPKTANAGQASALPSVDGMVPLSALDLSNPTRPEEIVGAFLEGMRSGNAKVIESMLSSRARQEIQAKGLEIAPIGSPQAAFEIGKAEQVDPKEPNVMLVTSNWLEPSTDGNATEYEVVWALVRETEGWRICAMAVDTHVEGEAIQVVNFENLAEVAPETAPGGAPAPQGARTATLPNGANGAPQLPPPPPSNAPALPPTNGGLPALPPSGAPIQPLPPTGLPPIGGNGQ